MKISSLFTQGNQSYIEGTGKDAEAVSEGLKNGSKEIAGKAPGQTVTGEIVSKSGNDLIISIGKDQLLHARLDGSIPVELGSQMSFAIKAMSGSKVILTPLFANTASDPSIAKALQMAGLPETETTAKMVQTMMQEGMSIDKDSLHQMMRTVSMYPDADMETLVQLTRLQIPVTEDSVFQMNAYKNYEHQMTESLLTIADSLTETLQGMVAEGKVSEGIALYKEIVFMLSEQGSEGVNAQETSPLLMADTEENTVLSLTGKETGEGITQEALPKEVLQAPAADAAETLFFTEEGAEQLAAGEKGILSGQEKEGLSLQLKQAGFETLGEAFSQGKITEGELFTQLNKLLSDTEAFPETQAESVVKLFEGTEIQKLLKNEMTKQWLLSPEEVGQENKVEKLYERLNSQMNRLGRALEQAAQEGTALAKTVANVTNNIDFMNQLNQMFTYVQIPLKLQGQEANGELYVYTNKKNLAKEDGEVSALLHLDMEHLGSVDVHVSMKDSKVATQFYLQDDSALDLIAEHIDMLNERLEKRGYSMSASFIHKEDEQENVMEEILKQDKNISLLSNYSFDARV